jgi:hypothetical protein
VPQGIAKEATEADDTASIFAFVRSLHADDTIRSVTINSDVYVADLTAYRT